MKRYFIEEVKCGTSNGGMACGPVPGVVVTSIKYKTEDESGWLTLIEADFPNYFLTDDDVFDRSIEDDYDEEFIEYMNDHAIGGFDDIDFGEYYDDALEEIKENPDSPAANLVKYLIILCRCPMNQVDELIEMATGKYADELDGLDDYIEEDDDEWEEDENVISRRVMYHLSEGVSCGPVAMGSVDAEIVIIDENKEKVYLHAEWVDEVDDEMLFEATKESIYDIHVQINAADDNGNNDEFFRLIDVRDEIRDKAIKDDSKFEKYYDELKAMVKEEIEKQGYDLEDEEWDEEEDEE